MRLLPWGKKKEDPSEPHDQKDEVKNEAQSHGFVRDNDPTLKNVMPPNYPTSTFSRRISTESCIIIPNRVAIPEIFNHQRLAEATNPFTPEYVFDLIGYQIYSALSNENINQGISDGKMDLNKHRKRLEELVEKGLGTLDLEDDHRELIKRKCQAAIRETFEETYGLSFKR